MMNAVFNKLMTQTFTIEKRGLNSMGDIEVIETYKKVKGFCEYVAALVTNERGERVRKPTVTYFRADTPLKPEPQDARWFIIQTAPYVRPEIEVERPEPIADPRTGKIHHYETLTR